MPWFLVSKDNFFCDNIWKEKQLLLWLMHTFYCFACLIVSEFRHTSIQSVHIVCRNIVVIPTKLAIPVVSLSADGVMQELRRWFYVLADSITDEAWNHFNRVCSIKPTSWESAGHQMRMTHDSSPPWHFLTFAWNHSELRQDNRRNHGAPRDITIH